MISDIKPKLSPVINLIAKPFLKINPNIITITGLIFPVLFLFFMSQKNYILSLIMLIGTAFDTIDGAVARLTNKVTKFGGLLDSTLDRVADALIIIGFSASGLVSINLVIVTLVTSYLISYIRSRAELASNGAFVLNIGVIERPERIALLGLALIFAFQPFDKYMIWGTSMSGIVFYLLVGLSIITIIQRLIVAKKRLSMS